jgi:hypothetical protein
VLDRVRAIEDELMQASDIDQGGIWPEEVEIAEKAERRVLGRRAVRLGHGGTLSRRDSTAVVVQVLKRVCPPV